MGCEQMKRDAYLMELDPKYCDVIVKRYVLYCKNNDLECRILLNGKILDKNDLFLNLKLTRVDKIKI